MVIFLIRLNFIISDCNFRLSKIDFILEIFRSISVDEFRVAKRNVNTMMIIDSHLRFECDANSPSSNCADLNAINEAIYEKYSDRNCDFNDVQLNLILKKLHGKRRNGDPMKQDHDIVVEKHCYVVNNGTEEQEILSNISVSKNFTGTNVIQINKTRGFSVNADNPIEIPFHTSKVKIDAEFCQNDTFIKNFDRFTDINSGDIKTNVPASSKIKVSLYVYKNVDVHNFLLDFELDENSSISCDGNETKTLLEFLPNGQYGNKGLQIEHTNGTFFVKNIPASETIVSFGIRTKFGTEEKI